VVHVPVAPRRLTPLSQYTFMLLVPTVTSVLELLLFDHLVVKNFFAHVIIDEHNILDSSYFPHHDFGGSLYK